MIPSHSLALPSFASSSGVLPGPSHHRISCCSAAASAAVAASPARGPSATLYEVLGVAAAASGREIKAAYRRLARACHPDAVAADRKGASTDEFMRIHAAYETLSDPEKRADYDQTIIALETTVLAAGYCRWPPYSSTSYRSYAAGCRRGRTWETDQCW